MIQLYRPCPDFSFGPVGGLPFAAAAVPQASGESILGRRSNPPDHITQHLACQIDPINSLHIHSGKSWRGVCNCLSFPRKWRRYGVG